jgi:glycosyltransferase involved in cell wall biosynthesis
MTPAPRFSVVIPTYQRRDLAVALVRALERQTYDGPFEMVVVVDGSTDGTVEALAQLHPQFQLRVIAQKNSGLARARNAGAGAAAGEILLFLDGDICLL